MFVRRAVWLLILLAVLGESVCAQEPAETPKSQAPGPAATRDARALEFANGLLRNRKFDLAADEFVTILASGPTGRVRDDARFGLAMARVYQAHYPEARQLFVDFLKDSPAGPRALSARYRVGELSYLLGDLPAARRALEELTQSKTDHPALEMAWTYLGDTCFGLTDWPAARTAYQQALTAYPQGRLASRARFGLGRTLAELGQRDQAVKTLRELARDGQPEWVDQAWLQIGLVLEGAQRFADAVDAFGQVDRIAPASPLRGEAAFHRALCLARLDRAAESQQLLRALASDPTQAMGARAALELATGELERDQPDAALRTLEDAIKRFPKAPAMPALQFRSAEALRKRKRFAEAQERFLHVAAAGPGDPWADDALAAAAQCAIDQNDPAEASRLAATFATRFATSPLTNEVRLIEAKAAIAQARPADAAKILEALQNIAEPSPGPAPAEGSPPFRDRARFELALAYRALGRRADSEAILSSLAQESGSSFAAEAQFLLGQSYLESAKYAACIPLLEKYLAARARGDVADHALAHVTTAQIELGELDRARETLGRLTAEFPGSPVLAAARLRLAEAELSARHHQPAADLFGLVANAAAANGPSNAGDHRAGVPDSLRVRALAGLGQALSALGKPAEAAQAYAKMLELAPNDARAPEIALAQARALDTGDRRAEALEAYASLIKRFPSADQATRARIASARLLVRAGQVDEATRAFGSLCNEPAIRDSLTRIGVAVDSVLDEWGWALIDADRSAEADAVWSRLLKEYPRSPHAIDARFHLAESANLKGERAEVVRLLTPLVTLTVDAPSSDGDPARSILPAALYRLGRTHAALNDWANAMAVLDRLLATFPANPYNREARYLRAVASLRAGDAAAAEAAFGALVSQPPGDADPKGLVESIKLKHIECAVALKHWKDVTARVGAMRASLPAGDAARVELDFAEAQALFGLGRLDDARALFQAVIDARGNADPAPQAQLFRGETYFHQDQFHDALREFLKVDVLYKSPHWRATALLEAGKVYERLDQWTDAAEVYGRICSEFPTDPNVPEAKDRRQAAERRAAQGAGKP